MSLSLTLTRIQTLNLVLCDTISVEIVTNIVGPNNVLRDYINNPPQISLDEPRIILGLLAAGWQVNIQANLSYVTEIPPHNEWL